MRDTSHVGGNSAARAQEAPGADDGRSDLERLRRDTSQRTTMVKTQDGVTGLGCFVPGHDGSTRTSARKQQISGGTTWRGGYCGRVGSSNREMEKCRAEECCSRLLSRTDSLLLRESVECCLDQQRGRRI